MGLTAAQRKQIARQTQAGGGAVNAAGGKRPRATKVSEALGAALKTLILDGRPFQLAPLDFNDLIDIEERYAGVESFFQRVLASDLRALRFFFWLVFRKTEPALTEEGTGRLIPIDQVEMKGVMVQLLTLTGLVEQDEGNAPAPAATPPTGS